MRTAAHDGPVMVHSGDVVLDGYLTRPADPTACVIVTSLGSTLQQTGYRRVADQFGAAGYAVLILDLLTEEEHQIDSRTEHYRWNVSLLAKRLRDGIRWIERMTDELPILVFASGSVAAAALRVDAMTGTLSGLLLTGARTDLVAEHLPRVQAPTLLLAVESDPAVLHMNNVAVSSEMKCIRHLHVVRDVTASMTDEQMIEEIVLHVWKWAVDHTMMTVGA
ncbi:MAG TPA: hypothetical protein VFM36_10165 [Thermoanaerobaculia bacterium]|nr:hypothetical protein [Thermoanaerobaculia bacterium]